MRYLDDLFAHQHNVVDHLYIQTADENYIAARWCSFYGLETDFFWLSAHSLEKYMKAILLLNERSAKRYLGTNNKSKPYGHDIRRLFEDVRALAPELLPDTLTCPKELPERLGGNNWPVEAIERFIERIHRYGQPDNRYQLVGHWFEGSDLLKLDQVVFVVRRLCRPLEAHFLGKANQHREDVPKETYRSHLANEKPPRCELMSRLEQIIAGEKNRNYRPLRRVLLKWNFAFAPHGYKGHGALSYPRISMRNPVLVRRVLDPLNKGKPEQAKIADEVWEWVKENVQLPPDMISDYEGERARRKAAAVAKPAKPAEG